MSNLCAEISSSAAEARSQAAISERIVKLEQELAELQIQSQLDKAELDAMEMVDQVDHFNQVKSKSIISQSADLQNYGNSIVLVVNIHKVLIIQFLLVVSQCLLSQFLPPEV